MKYTILIYESAAAARCPAASTGAIEVRPNLSM
jgi:hypothetical protein